MPYDLFAIGVAGGIAAEVAGWFKIRRELHRGLPDWSKSKLYWFITVVMALMGGLIVFIYWKSGTFLNAFLAFNVGASAPLILERLVDQAPSLEPGASE
jgi:hypothetical protein